MSTRTLSRSLVQAVLDAQETMGHCATTINARLPILTGWPDAAALAEWNQAYTEKVAATWEGVLAASAAWQSALVLSAFRAPNPAALGVDLLNVMSEAGAPARKRVKANAKRLGARTAR